MPAVAQLYKFMHDLGDGNLMDIKQEIETVRQDLGVRFNNNSTIWNSVYN